MEKEKGPVAVGKEITTKRTSRNITTGNIIWQIVLTALPLLAGQVMQNLYNSVDSMVVGNFIGKTALAAVSASGDVSRVIVNFFVGLSTGAGIVFGRCFGAGDITKLRRAIHTALPVALGIGTVMASLGILFTPQIMQLVHCPADVWNQAATYLRIYLISTVPLSVYNVSAGVLRSVGDTRTPFIYLCVSCSFNIVLDIVLVAILQFGVAGVAIATLMAQSLSVTLILRKMLCSQDVYRITWKEMRVDWGLLKEILVLGLPAGIQSCIVGFSNLFVQRYTNSFASAAMAGVGVAKKLDLLLTDIAQSLALGTTVFISQNLGAKKYKRALCSVYQVLGLSIALTMTVAGVYVIWAPQICSVFNQDPDVVRYGANMLRTICPLYWLMCFNQTFMFANRAFGKAAVSMVNGILGNVVMRQIFLAVFMNIDWNIRYIYLSWPAGWGFSAMLNALYFTLVVRTNYKKKIRNEENAFTPEKETK